MRKHFATISTYLVALLLIGFSIFPVIWMFTSSFLPASDIYSVTPKFSLRNGTFENYRYVLGETHTLKYFWNSIIIALCTTLISIILAILAGYGFARFRFSGKNILSIFVLLSQMLPLVVVLVPLYLVLSKFGLLDTKTGLVLAYLIFTIPLSTWFLRGFFETIPSELEEAALVDGCTRFGALIRVIIPVSTPGIFATATYAFIVAWQEFLFSLSFTLSHDSRTLPVGISSFIGQYNINWGAVMASSTLVSIPVMVLFLAFYDQFVQSFTEGIIK